MVDRRIELLMTLLFRKYVPRGSYLEKLQFIKIVKRRFSPPPRQGKGRHAGLFPARELAGDERLGEAA